MDLNFPFEVRAVFNRDTMRHDIPHHDGRLPEIHSVTGLDITVQLALNDHATSIDVGVYLAVRPDREAIPAQFDAAFYLAVHIQIFTAGKFTLDHN